MSADPDHATNAPPEAMSVPGSDESALRALLLRQRDLFPALRRDDCPPQTLDEYLRTSGLITALRMRLGDARYYTIKAEVGR